MSEYTKPRENSPDFTPFVCPMNDESVYAINNRIEQRAFDTQIPRNTWESFRASLRDRSQILHSRLFDIHIEFGDIIEGLKPVQRAYFYDAILNLLGVQPTWAEKTSELFELGWPQRDREKFTEVARQMDLLNAADERIRREPRSPDEVTHAEVGDIIVRHTILIPQLRIQALREHGGEVHNL